MHIVRAGKAWDLLENFDFSHELWSTLNRAAVTNTDEAWAAMEVAQGIEDYIPVEPSGTPMGFEWGLVQHGDN